MTNCQPDLLDSLLHGEVDCGVAEKLRLHLSVCSDCTDELTWLRAEKELFAPRRRSTLSPAIWTNIQARITRKKPRAWTWSFAREGVLFFSAALGALVMFAPLAARESTPSSANASVAMCMADAAPDSSDSDDVCPAAAPYSHAPLFSAR